MRVCHAGRRAVVAAVVVLGLAGSGLRAQAQEGPGGALNPNRDCITVVNCQYAKGGSFRGCVSSYRCKTCRFVRANCSVGDTRNVCRRLRCSWDG